MRKFFVFVVMALLLLQGAYGFVSAGTDLYYTFDNADLSGSNPTDVANSFDGTTSGATTGFDGLIGESFDFDGTDDYVQTTWDIASNGALPISFSFWFNTTEDMTGDRITMVGAWDEQGTVDPYLRIGFDDVAGSPNRVVVALRGDSVALGINRVQSTGTYNDGALHHIAVVIDAAANITLYLDGGEDTNVLLGDFAGNFDWADDFVVGGYPEGGAVYEHFDGEIDEFAIFDYALTADNVTDLYNAGAGLQYPFSGVPGAPSAPSWVDPTPVNATANNTQVTLNASCAAGLNYYMWFDGSNPPTTAVLSNSSVGAYTTSVGVEGVYYYSAACYNVSSGLFSTNSTPRSWTYDVTQPAIVLNGENEFNDANRSVLVQFDAWLNLSMNFTDNIDLFAWNITINASNGTTMYSAQNESLSGTSWVMTRNVNVTSWPAGWYTSTVYLADSHTAEKIPDYQVSSKKSSITFKPGNDNNIKIETRESSTITAEKLEDRYTFRMVFDDPVTRARTFDVKTDKCPLYYRSGSGYKAHFVSFCDSKTEGNWIDFEGAAGTAVISRVDDFHYRVDMEAVPGDVTFRSIGGLNTYTRSWDWYRGTEVHGADRATAGDPFSIWVNLTHDASFSLDASLLWNGTAQNVTQTNGTGWRYFSATLLNESLGTYWYEWTVNNTQDDGNVSQFVINETHAVEDWYIDSCSAASARIIRWRQYDENNPTTPLNGTIQVLIEYWPVSQNNSKTFNASYGTANVFEVCVSPGDLNITADVYLQNTVPGAFTHRFYVQEGSFNNQTTNYSIFNFVNQTGISDMKITTRLEDDYSYLENVLVYLQRQYVGEGVWRTVQMDRSGDYGLVFFNIKEENTDYRLLYYDADNNLLKQTVSMKFVCSAGVCDLTQLLGAYEETTTSDQVTASVSFDNATRVITVDWTGPPSESHTVVFGAVKETVTGPLTLCSGIQVGASGSFTCNTSGVSGQVFVSATVDGSESAAAEWVDTRSSTLGGTLSRAESSLWSFGLAATIVMIGVFSPVGAVIALVVGLIMIFFLGILGPLSLTALILAAVVGIAISLKVRT